MLQALLLYRQVILYLEEIHLFQGLHLHREIQEKTCRILMNMLSVKEQFPKPILERDDLILKLMSMLLDARDSVKLELSWVFHNMLYCAPPKVLTDFLVKYKDTIFETLLNSLDGCNDPRFLLKMLCTIENLLRHGKRLEKD